MRKNMKKGDPIRLRENQTPVDFRLWKGRPSKYCRASI